LALALTTYIKIKREINSREKTTAGTYIALYRMISTLIARCTGFLITLVSPSWQYVLTAYLLTEMCCSSVKINTIHTCSHVNRIISSRPTYVYNEGYRNDL